MEYCRCGSLDCYELKNVFSEDELKDITACCLMGFMSIRGQKIVHGVIAFVVSFLRISNQLIFSFQKSG